MSSTILTGNALKPESKGIVAKALEYSSLLLESVELIKGYCRKHYGV